MSSPNTKGLVYRFWRLDDSQKRDIMLKLNLITEGDLWMSDADLYDRGLRLAAQRGLLEELALHVKLLDQNG